MRSQISLILPSICCNKATVSDFDWTSSAKVTRKWDSESSMSCALDSNLRYSATGNGPYNKSRFDVSNCGIYLKSRFVGSGVE